VTGGPSDLFFPANLLLGNVKPDSAPPTRSAPCARPGSWRTTVVQIPIHRGQSFRRIADSIPVIADSF
jgi:hypothetical protein